LIFFLTKKKIKKIKNQNKKQKTKKIFYKQYKIREKIYKKQK